MDYTIYVIDIAGGDKVPRKGGPGITQSDFLVINKTDLAPHVGADLTVMAADSAKMRGAGPFVFAQVTHGSGLGRAQEAQPPCDASFSSLLSLSLPYTWRNVPLKVVFRWISCYTRRNLLELVR